MYLQLPLKYLEVIIDQKLNFKTHLESLTTKVFGMSTLLAKILPNIDRQKQTR